jgi:adenylate cyclase
MSEQNGCSQDAVRDQLEKILSSSKFQASRKQQKFLSYVVEETLQGRSADLKAYTIALNVYGRDESFDPQTDPIVRVEAGRLRRALDQYYATEGKRDELIIHIPKGGYRPIFIRSEAQGLVESPAERAAQTNGESPKHSLAVLPLKNLSDDGARDYFAEGLTAELTSELARYQDISVIASQSSLQFKDKDKSYQHIGNKIGARFLLEGTIRTNRDEFKTALHLIDSETAEQVWHKDFKGVFEPKNLILMQEEIAQSVIGCIADQFGALARVLSREARKSIPTSLHSYDAVLRFHQFEQTLTKEAFNSAFSSLETAVASDPDYGLAWSTLAHLLADNHALMFREIESSLDKAERFAKKGVALIPENQFAHDALALVYFHRGNKELFLRHAEEAILLNPKAPYIVGVAGWHMMLLGEWERGRALLHIGMRLNPLHPTWFYLAPFAYHYHRGAYEQAYLYAKKFNYPQLFWDQVMRGAALAMLKDYETAEKVVQELLELMPDFASHARQLIRGYIKVAEVEDQIIFGLQQAGLGDLR